MMSNVKLINILEVQNKYTDYLFDGNWEKTDREMLDYLSKLLDEAPEVKADDV